MHRKSESCASPTGPTAFVPLLHHGQCLGETLHDEGEDRGGLTYAKAGRAILAQPGASGYQIFDSKTIHLLEDRYSTGRPVVAQSIGELALKLGIPAEALKRTVDEFNAAVQPGQFDPAVKDGKGTRGIDPPKSNWPSPWTRHPSPPTRWPAASPSPLAASRSTPRQG